jgi:hypothetical protein
MAKSVAKKASNLFVWIILGLLFVALAGFGIGSFSGGGSRIGSCRRSSRSTADEYARATRTKKSAPASRPRRASRVTLSDAAGASASTRTVLAIARDSKRRSTTRRRSWACLSGMR